MPTYVYGCSTCHRSRDIIKSLALLDREEVCETCQAPMDRRVTAAAVASDYSGYTCPITDKWIEGRRAHTENLKRHGCRVLEAGETEQVRRNRKAENAAQDRAVDQTVDKFYSGLSADKAAQLENEVRAGADLEYQRSAPGTKSSVGI